MSTNHPSTKPSPHTKTPSSKERREKGEKKKVRKRRGKESEKKARKNEEEEEHSQTTRYGTYNPASAFFSTSDTSDSGHDI